MSLLWGKINGYNFIMNINRNNIHKIAKSVGIIYGVYVLSAVALSFINEKRHEYNAFTSTNYILRNTDLNGKIAIITGASSGIGSVTAQALLNKGCKVYMACRNITKAEKVRDKIVSKLDENIDPNNVQILKVDLGSLQSVYDFSKNVVNKNIKVNYLINNAGVMGVPKYWVTKDNIEYQFGINYLGHYYMTKLLLPILKQNKTRIINVSSTAHFWGLYDKTLKLFDYCIQNKCYMGSMKNIYSGLYAYGVSKSCIILFSKYINKTFNSDGIYSVSLHPGIIFTSLFNDMKISDFILYIIGEGVVKPWKWLQHLKVTFSLGTATTLRCVTLTNNEIKNSKTQYYFACRPWNIDNASIARNDDNTDIIIDKLTQLSDILIMEAGFKLSLY